MAGAKGVKMVEPGNGKGSRIYEVCASGDMPRGGAPLTAGELASLEKWITAGAKYDGANPAGPIGAGLPAPTKGGPPVALAKATGNEKVSYSLVTSPPCWPSSAPAATERGKNPGNEPAGQLTMTNLLKGGDSGPIGDLGQGATTSLLIVKKIKGTASDGGTHAAASLRALSAERDRQVRDLGRTKAPSSMGLDANMDTLAWWAPSTSPTMMTYDELAAKRLETAGKNWALGNPDDTPENGRDGQLQRDRQRDQEPPGRDWPRRPRSSMAEMAEVLRACPKGRSICSRAS